jgi:hypothetical protein
MDQSNGPRAFRLVAPSGAPIIGTSERIDGTAYIAGVDVQADGTWEVQHEGWTEIDWNSETTVNEGTDLQFDGVHGACGYQEPHSHPDPAYDEFVAEDGSLSLRKDLLLEYWDETQARWVAAG